MCQELVTTIISYKMTIISNLKRPWKDTKAENGFQNQFRYIYIFKLKKRATIHIFKHNGKTKVHGKGFDLWPWNWSLKRAWNSIKKGFENKVLQSFFLKYVKENKKGFKREFSKGKSFWKNIKHVAFNFYFKISKKKNASKKNKS